MSKSSTVWASRNDFLLLHSIKSCCCKVLIGIIFNVKPVGKFLFNWVEKHQNRTVIPIQKKNSAGIKKIEYLQIGQTSSVCTNRMTLIPRLLREHDAAFSKGGYLQPQAGEKNSLSNFHGILSKQNNVRILPQHDLRETVP